MRIRIRIRKRSTSWIFTNGCWRCLNSTTIPSVAGRKSSRPSRAPGSTKRDDLEPGPLLAGVQRTLPVSVVAAELGLLLARDRALRIGLRGVGAGGRARACAGGPVHDDR